MHICDPVKRTFVGAVVSAGVLVGAAAAPAAAQTVSVARACYVNANPMVGAPIHVSGSGFAAGDNVELSGTDVFGTTTVGGAGTFAAIIKGPILTTAFPAARSFTLTARDETNGMTTASTTFRVTNLAFRTKPGVARPSATVRYSFSGFRGGHAIYGHFVHRRQVLTHRFGRATGACGMLKARSKLFPGGHPQFTHYKVQFDDARRYHPKAAPRIDTDISIRPF
jgi:hypothetical protein